MRRTMPLGAGLHIDEDPAVLDLDRKSRNPVILEARLAKTGDAMKFPLMPGADDVVAVQRALAQRAADMIAAVVNGAELSRLAAQGDLDRPGLATLQ